MSNAANARLELGPDGTNLIATFEGLRLRAYLDTEGIPTIGYGTTSASGVPVRLGMTITRQQAVDYMQSTVRKIYGKAVKDAVNVPLRQQEYDALVSFTYNVGPGALRRSTLLKLLNRGDYDGAGRQLLRWTNSRSGNAKKGLTRRRKAELAVWMSAGREYPVNRIAELQAPADTLQSEELPDEAFAKDQADDKATLASKPAHKSTTVQAAAAATAATSGLVAEHYDEITTWLTSGQYVQIALAAVVIVGFVWMVYARFFRDQEPLAA